MRLTKDIVDSTSKQIDEFEKTIPGIRYSGDYPEFALAVVGSESFKAIVTSTTIIGMLGVMMLPKNKEGETEAESKAALNKLLENSPIKEPLLRAIYLGYKLGKGEIE